MIEQLFGSKTRVKLLKLFYANPNRAFYVREITRKIDEQINSVRRELANLLSIGIITSDETNHKLYYEVNQKYDLFRPLAEIFGGAAIADKPEKGKAVKLTSENADQPAALKNLGNVELALYTGQFTRDETAGVDLLLVGDLNATQLHKFIEDLEKKEKKEIRYVVMTFDEYNYRVQVKDRFVSTIVSAKKQILIDKHGLLSSAKK